MEVAFIGAGAILGSSFFLWALQRCGVHGSFVSATWPPAAEGDARRFLRMSNAILAAYEHDLQRPRYSPNLQGMHLIKKVGYARGPLQCPPYAIFVREASAEVVVAIRGMHLLKESGYVTFLRTWRAHAELDCGYVHRGFLLSAQWLLAEEAPTLSSLLRVHPGYALVFTGHSEGAGVAALCAIAVSCGAAPLGVPPAAPVRCVAFAPPRVASRALCRKHWGGIDAVVLQDDFLPRTSVPVHIILGAAFCLPVVLGASCLKDLLLPRGKCASEEDLQVPGKLFHIVYTKFCSHSCRTYRPQIRRSEREGDEIGQIVCSANALEDHSLLRARAKLDLALEDCAGIPQPTHNQSPVAAPVLVRCSKDVSDDQGP